MQLWLYIKGAVQLDLGYSFRQQMPVAEMIGDRLPATLLLTGVAFVLSLVLGVTAGVAASARQGRWGDTLISTFALLFYATPLFWVALMATLVFSVWLEWLPGFGYSTIGAGYTGMAHVLDVAKHLVLPASTLGLFFMAIYMRMTRASMLEVSRLDFVKTARAKGLRPSRVNGLHALRNAMIPVVTVIGLSVGTLLAGAILTETIFSWPGIGKWMVDSIFRRDYPVVQGGLLLIAVMVMIVNLTVDLLYGFINPKIRKR